MSILVIREFVKLREMLVRPHHRPAGGRNREDPAPEPAPKRRIGFQPVE
jgi:hypothetical protein